MILIDIKIEQVYGISYDVLVHVPIVYVQFTVQCLYFIY